MTSPDLPPDDTADTSNSSSLSSSAAPPSASQHHSLKYHLLGPSLTKPGQDGVDQRAVSEIIYNASKGSRYFTNEENKDKTLTVKINRILAKKRELERIEAAGGLKTDVKRADDYIAELECGRELGETVVHVDCDMFYAAVEELDRPELREVPFAVGKGVLTTCNYVARKFGCRSGMAGFVADKLCPELIHLPLNFDKYTAKAKETRTVFARYDPHYQSASLDEAYLNITAYCREHEMGPDEAVAQMRAEVFEESRITVSAGIAANAKLAKICSNKNKPNGQFRVPPDRASIVAFMRDLPTRKVNGIGRVFERELDAIGIKTCGEIYSQRHYLQRLFGEKAFQFLIGVYLGLGRTEIRPLEESERKSVGTESTFHDISGLNELREKLWHTAEELEKDMQRTQFKGRTLVLKVKLHSYEVLSRQVQPPKAVHTKEDLYHYGLPMLAKLEKEMPGMRLRLLGLRCTHLVSMKKGDVDFFGRARQQGETSRESGAGTSEAKVPVDEDGWQIWPDSVFEDAAEQERLEEAEEMERLSQEYIESHNNSEPTSPPENEKASPDPDYTRQANGFAWRSILEKERAKEEAEREKNKPPIEQWTCPICSVPQSADEKLFNEHIDGCLSRQTIKEIVQTGNEDAERWKTGSPLQDQRQNGKKRGRPREETVGKKAKKAFFS